MRPATDALGLGLSADGVALEGASDGLGSALADEGGAAVGEGSPGPVAAPHPPRHSAAAVDTATTRHRPVAMAANLAGPANGVLSSSTATVCSHARRTWERRGRGGAVAGADQTLAVGSHGRSRAARHPGGSRLHHHRSRAGRGVAGGPCRLRCLAGAGIRPADRLGPCKPLPSWSTAAASWCGPTTPTPGVSAIPLRATSRRRSTRRRSPASRRPQSAVAPWRETSAIPRSAISVGRGCGCTGQEASRRCRSTRWPRPTTRTPRGRVAVAGDARALIDDAYALVGDAGTPYVPSRVVVLEQLVDPEDGSAEVRWPGPAPAQFLHRPGPQGRASIACGELTGSAAATVYAAALENHEQRWLVGGTTRVLVVNPLPVEIDC